MSKNKDIEALHRITGEPYRVCRAKMKANGWDLWNALDLNIFDSLSDAITDTFAPVIDALFKAVNSIDWEELRRAMNAELPCDTCAHEVKGCCAYKLIEKEEK